MFAIIASGPNDIQVPCLFFETETASKEFLTSKGLKEQTYKDTKGNEYSQWLVPEFEEYVRDHGEDGPEEIFFYAFFNHYYSGCGGVYSFSINEIELGKPIVGWDLD